MFPIPLTGITNTNKCNAYADSITSFRILSLQIGKVHQLQAYDPFYESFGEDMQSDGACTCISPAGLECSLSASPGRFNDRWTLEDSVPHHRGATRNPYVCWPDIWWVEFEVPRSEREALDNIEYRIQSRHTTPFLHLSEILLIPCVSFPPLLLFLHSAAEK